MYAKYSDEFISKFPTSAFGYKEKATYLTDKAEYDAAAKLMEEGIKKSAAKDEAHSNYADLIYQKIIYNSHRLGQSGFSQGEPGERRRAMVGHPGSDTVFL